MLFLPYTFVASRTTDSAIDANHWINREVIRRLNELVLNRVGPSRLVLHALLLHPRHHPNAAGARNSFPPPPSPPFPLRRLIISCGAEGALSSAIAEDTHDSIATHIVDQLNISYLL